MKYQYKPVGGVCSQNIIVDIENDGKINSVDFIGGCPGNLLGIGKLTKGMMAQEVIEKLSGIKCGGKETSCPDQYAVALTKILDKINSK